MRTEDIANTLSVLLIEDDPEEVQFVTQHLGQAADPGYEVTHCHTLASAQESMSDFSFDIILTDIILPDSQGIDTFLKLRETNPQIPVIILTDANNSEVALEAVKAGAQNYLVNGQFLGNLLTRDIQYAMARHQMLNAYERQANSLWSFRSYLESIVLNIPDAIIVTSDEGEILFSNPEACSMLGREMDKINGSELPFPVPTDLISELNFDVGENAVSAEARKRRIKWYDSDAVLLSIRQRI